MCIKDVSNFLTQWTGDVSSDSDSCMIITVVRVQFVCLLFSQNLSSGYTSGACNKKQKLQEVLLHKVMKGVCCQFG